MRVCYYLSTCSTCKSIIKQPWFPKDILLIDIKFTAIEKVAIETAKIELGTYEALFSKKSKKYPLIKDKIVEDKDFLKAILEEYTFLKRPLLIYDEYVSVGNDKNTVMHLKDRFSV